MSLTDIHKPIGTLIRLNDSHTKALKKLGLSSIEDLLYHFPFRYGDTAKAQTIDTLQPNTTATVFGTIKKLTTKKSFRGRVPMAEATIDDGHGTLKVVWFNQPYLAKMIADGSKVRLDGTISARRKKDGSLASLSMANPHIEVVEKIPDGVGDSLFGESDDSHRLYPVYPETKGITSNWIYHTIQRAFKSGVLDGIEDPIPQNILSRYNLPSLKTAMVWIHTPKREADALAARKRFAFEEIFLIQLNKRMQRIANEKKKSFSLLAKQGALADFTDRFPFAMTEAQKRCVASILEDIGKTHPMSRLLEGDVGSGKTAVAAVTTYAATVTRPQSGKEYGAVQTAYMAPTEILATQLFENFITYFAHTGISIALVTGSGCRKFPSKVDPTEATDISRTQLCKWVANGEIPIVVGTHSLIQKSVEFKNLGLVIIDEQHRFGTAQRQKLATKNDFAPHLLSMTATPIPRTLALTLYGDLDLSVLDQMPAGRKPVITRIVRPSERKTTYDEIQKQLSEGRQVYVICPRIDEPDPNKQMTVLAKSVKEEAKRLQKSVFPNAKVGVMHGKLSPKEKDRVMKEFETRKIDVLVSTSVVEVGVNVPNASVMIIEGAERFGLAQLHQLRGRIIRGTHQGYCYIFTDSTSDTTIKRLEALTKAVNGFELAEHDLKLRGAGELAGGKQWGISDLAMEAIQNMKLVEAARTEAARLTESQETISQFPLLLQAALSKGNIHFE